MTSGDDIGESVDMPELATAVDELRWHLRVIDDIAPADMGGRSYI